MSAAASIQRAITRYGRTVVLQRRIGTTNAFVQVAVLAMVVNYKPDELTGGLTAADNKVLIAPGLINAGVWPGEAGGPFSPRVGDQVVIDGRPRQVLGVKAPTLKEDAVVYQLAVKG